jgi:RimJ/RimL family protein N-acetyltransferase
MESSSVASSYVIRPAHPRDAAALVALAEEVVAEPEGWLVSDGGWRTVTDERRYLRAIRRYSDAAVFVAEGEGGIVGRLSLGRDPHPASRHVADLGLMVAAGARRQGIGRALLEQASASSSCTSSRTTMRRSPCTNSSASDGRATARSTTVVAATSSTRS